LRAETLRRIATGSLHEDKAEDVTVIDLAGKTTLADFMIIASGRSRRHVTSIAEHLAVRLKRLGIGAIGIEGLAQADWVLIDAGDVIVHIFRPEVRSFYNLEKMWAVPLPEPAVQ
jgi:ribosome-associated protein